MGASKEDMEKMGMDTSTFTSPESMMKKMGKSSMSTLDGDF